MMQIISRDYDTFNMKFALTQRNPDNYDGVCHRVLGEGVYMSTDPQITHCNGNILLIGASESGKSSRFFAPNILREQVSMVVHDPFGTYYADCKQALEEKGFAVEQFVPDEDQPDKYPDWNRLRTEKLALFVCTDYVHKGTRPATDLFANMVPYFLSEDKISDNPIALFLDEFQICGEIEDFGRFLSLSYQRNISCVIGLQSIYQLQRHYRESWQIIVANFHTTVFYGTPRAGRENCEYISQRIGYTSKEDLSHILKEPETVEWLDPNYCLIFVRGEEPLLAKKYSNKN